MVAIGYADVTKRLRAIATEWKGKPLAGRVGLSRTTLMRIREGETVPSLLDADMLAMAAGYRLALVPVEGCGDGQVAE